MVLTIRACVYPSNVTPIKPGARDVLLGRAIGINTLAMVYSGRGLKK